MGDSMFMTANQIAQDARRSRTVKDETHPTAPLLEETFAHSFANLGAQLVAIRQQGEKRYKRSPAYKQERKAARAGNRKPSKRVSYTDEEAAALRIIEVRAKELRQVESIVSADPELMTLVDASIAGIHVKAAQRRQSRTLIAVAILSLIAGWLLSAISPATAVVQLLAR
jgi:hypothetical protein